MKSLTVTIPRPPSANHLFANAPGKGRVKTGAYKAWIERAGLALNRLAAGAGQISGPVSLRIVLDKRRGDLANYEKPTTDLLVRHSLIDDDRNVVQLFMQHSETMGDKCSVTVEQVAALRGRKERAA